MTHYSIGFIMEQALGHVTHTRNLQANVAQVADINALWGLIPWETNGLAAQIPVYKSNWTVRAGMRARRTIADMTRKNKIDALFFHTQVPAMLAANWIKRYPSVISLDATPIQYDSLGEFYAHAQGPEWLEHLKWQLNRNTFRTARHIVTWSHWAKQGLIKDYDVAAEKVTVIPPGVNTASWKRPEPRAYHDGPTRILFVGANLERKGGLVLLEAFRALRNLNVELHLVTRDKAPEESGIYTYHNMQPNSPELRALYHKCDIFCLPTYGDCLPMVLSEAGAAGLPSVTTRVAAIPEIVHEGETGFVVPPGDADALAIALKQLIQNPDLRLRQGARAVEVVSGNFDGQHNACRLLDLLRHEVDDSRTTRKG